MSQRTVRLVTSPRQPRQHAPGMVNRPLIEPGHWADFDPFLLLMEDWMREPGGFPDHPHRGIETVTLVLDGELQHADNRGNSGVLVSDDIQWMTAGRGIIHAELPNEDKLSHTLQLWLNMPAAKKMVDSGYQDLRASDSVNLEDDQASLRLVSGAIEGVAGTIQNHTPVQYLDVRVQAGGRTSLSVPAAHNGFVLVLEGDVRVGPHRTPAAAGQVLWLDYPSASSTDKRLDTLEVFGDTPARVLVITGTPIREPVVAYGPFVMNTEAEIYQAYVDFHSGKFGGPTPAALAVARR